MKDLLTIIVLTHNNHSYLPRVLEHYRTFDCSVLIADSSRQKYEGDTNGLAYAHFALPTFMAKLEAALDLIRTKYVALVGVDDFLVEDGVRACADFLEAYEGFVSAQGNSILYRKQPDYSRYMELLPMYPPDQLSFEIAGDDPFARLRQVFHPYRTIFCAMHHTAVLYEAYKGIDSRIRNLFLNEYLTAIVPIASGRHKELPVFYQVRESADDSGDKVTPNLDTLFADDAYDNEVEIYINYLSNIISRHTGRSAEECAGELRKILEDYAAGLAARRAQDEKKSFTKKLGGLLSHLPLGRALVMSRRLKRQQQSIASVIRTDRDRQNLEHIKTLISRHAQHTA